MPTPAPYLAQINVEGVPPPMRDAFVYVARQLDPWLRGVSTALAGGLSFAGNFDAQLDVLDLSVPTDWLYLNAPGAPPLLNTWKVETAGKLPRIRRVGDEVQMAGLVNAPAAGAVDSTRPIFNLPDDARWLPDSDGAILSVWSSAGVAGIQATARRAVYIQSGGANSAAYSLDSVRYVARSRAPIPAGIYPIHLKKRITGALAGCWAVSAVALDASKRAVDNSYQPARAVMPEAYEVTKDKAHAIRLTNVLGLHPGRTWRVALLSFSG